MKKSLLEIRETLMVWSWEERLEVHKREKWIEGRLTERFSLEEEKGSSSRKIGLSAFLVNSGA